MEAQSQPTVVGIRKLYSCSDCGRNFKRNSHLVRHKRLHTGEKPYKCPDCGKSFRQSTDVNTHRRIHTGETPYQCNQCGKSFRYRPSLLKHLRCHDEEKLYNCLECGKSFSFSLVSSTCQSSCVQRKPYICPDCDENVQEISNLVVHVPMTSDSYACPDCGKSFSCNFQLIKHRSLHTRFLIPNPNSLCSLDQSPESLPSDHQDAEETDSPGSICEARDDLVAEGGKEGHLQQRAVLPARSYRTLLGRLHGLGGQRSKAHKDRPKCRSWQWKHPEIDEDESTVKDGADVPEYERLLSSKRNHLCFVCGKQFRYESQLVAHERIHTGEKPFECSICKKSFRDKSDLCKHQKIHSEDRPYKCLDCGRTFHHQLTFVRHQRLHPRKQACEDGHVYVAVLPSYRVGVEASVVGGIQPPEALSFHFKEEDPSSLWTLELAEGTNVYLAPT
ncbi:zinc finger protein 271-like isoform X1 [Eublepharis macularius]|uniref:Zinc finger protein 271-like isoform X1 n=1 Tax=Eublepharis macularius TaxID=481883 RepID=A0AA97KYS7_EUBMA|nr:zinc finger protein 271-like isoform X1 [Eublepharis macularius]